MTPLEPFAGLQGVPVQLHGAAPELAGADPAWGVVLALGLGRLRGADPELLGMGGTVQK